MALVIWWFDHPPGKPICFAYAPGTLATVFVWCAWITLIIYQPSTSPKRTPMALWPLARETPSRRKVTPKPFFSLAFGNIMWPCVKSQILPPVNIPSPTEIGSKMGGAPTNQNGIPLVLTHSHVKQTVQTSGSGASFKELLGGLAEKLEL